MKLYKYLNTLKPETLEKMYSLIFGNPIEHYIEMEEGQMIEEIIDEINNNN